MKRLFVLCAIASQAHARDIEVCQLDQRLDLDRDQETLIVFPEPVHLSLAPSALQLNPLGEGEASKVWKAKPSCADCEIDAEFLTVGGRQIKLLLRAKSGHKDHVLTIHEEPQVGSIPAPRKRITSLAREALIRTVRGWPPLAQTQDEVPAEIVKKADKWTSFRTDQLIIFRGENHRFARDDIPKFKLPGIVMIGFHRNDAIVITRRSP